MVVPVLAVTSPFTALPAPRTLPRLARAGTAACAVPAARS